MATNRDLKNSRFNREDIDPDDAYNRAVSRGQDMTHDRLDPQSGPVENRRRGMSRKTPKGL